MQAQTPTKKAKSGKRGRKANVDGANDYCRLCNCALKIKYGDFGKTSYVSFQNLFIRAKGFEDKPTLQELCQELGFCVENSPQAADRVCKACSRKIRNAHELYTFIGTNLKRDEIEKRDDSSNISDSREDGVSRFKRLLPSSVCSPDRSPQAKKTSKTQPRNGKGSTSRKTLAFDHGSQAVQDNFLSHLNVDGLVDNKVTEVKVVVLDPSGRISTHSSFDDSTKRLLINLVRKNWTSAANIILQHAELKPELPGPISRTVMQEFATYCGNEVQSVLQRVSPVDIAALSNRVVLKEVETWCPFWYHCVQGACNAVAKSKKKNKSVDVENNMALSSGIAARWRNHKMNALAYRISTVLFHSGVKHEDINRLQKLGVSVSAKSIVKFQKEMGNNSEAKIEHWKKNIERNALAKLLLLEVKEKQVGTREEDDMMIEVAIDFSEETIKEYENYNDHDLFLFCTKLLASGNVPITDDDLEAALSQLSNDKLPYYR